MGIELSLNWALSAISFSRASGAVGSTNSIATFFWRRSASRQALRVTVTSQLRRCLSSANSLSLWYSLTNVS